MKGTACAVKVLVIVTALWVLGTGVSPFADETNSASVPPGGLSVLPHDPLQALHWYPQNDPGLAQSEIVEVRDMPFQRAIRTVIHKTPTHPWDVVVRISVSEPINAGDVCLLSFFMRGTSLSAESAGATVHACVEYSRRPHDKLMQKSFAGRKEWRRIYIPFRATTALPAKSVRVVYFLGFRPQTVEIGGLEMLNFGSKVSLADLPVTRMTYRGREPDAPWRKEALARIDGLRKARLVVEVVDSTGLPVGDAHVHARMVRHAFGFGSAVTARLLGVNTENSEAERAYLSDFGGASSIRTYRKMVEKLFNKATLENDLKTKPWIRSRSNKDPDYRRAWTDRALEWLTERDIEVRGHWIACGDPEELPRAIIHSPLSQLRSYLFADMRERVMAFGHRIKEWDAINHIVGGSRNLESLFGSPDIYVEIMKEARNLAPDAQLWVNEGLVLAAGDRREPYERVIRYLIDHAAPPDGIGFMGHFDQVSLTPPEEFLEVFDRFARLIPRLQITELDVDVGDDEILQAEYMRDVMTAAFSHVACRGIVLWGFWENSHWKRDAALYRRDWSPKPSGRMWEDLVFREWWTNAEGKSDRNGLYELRGFLGQYEVQVTLRDRSAKAGVSLPKEGTRVKIVLR